MCRGRPPICRELAEGAQRGPVCGPGHRRASPHARRIPAVGDARETLELCKREAERLADIADRAAAAVARERGDERRMPAAVALGDAEDQLLADVAREVEVDVGHRHHLVVDEPAERELVGNGIDVREAGEKADDRADARPAAASRWQRVARAAGAAHLDAGSCELGLPVQEKKPARPAGDQIQLILGRAARVSWPVAFHGARRTRVADWRSCVGRIGAVREVGIAVAELLREVEVQRSRSHACGCRTRGRRSIISAGAQRTRGSAPLALAAVE